MRPRFQLTGCDSLSSSGSDYDDIFLAANDIHYTALKAAEGEAETAAALSHNRHNESTWNGRY